MSSARGTIVPRKKISKQVSASYTPPDPEKLFKYVHSLARELESPDKLARRARRIAQQTGLESLPLQCASRISKIADKMRSLDISLVERGNASVETARVVQDVFFRAFPDIVTLHLARSQSTATNSVEYTGNDNVHSEQLFGANAAPRSLSSGSQTHWQILFDPVQPQSAPPSWMAGYSNQCEEDGNTAENTRTVVPVPAATAKTSVVQGGWNLVSRPRGGLICEDFLDALEHDFVGHLTSEWDMLRRSDTGTRPLAYISLPAKKSAWDKFSSNFTRPVYSEQALASEIIDSADNLFHDCMADRAVLSAVAKDAPRVELRTAFLTIPEHAVYGYISRRYSPRACLAFVHFLVDPVHRSANWLDSITGVPRFGELIMRLLAVARNNTLGPLAPSRPHVTVNMPPTKKNYLPDPSAENTLEEFAKQYGVFDSPQMSSAALEPTEQADLSAETPALYSGTGAIDLSTTARKSYANGTFSIDSVSGYAPPLQISASAGSGDGGSADRRPELDRILQNAGIRDSLAEHIADKSFWSTLTDYARPDSEVVLPDPVLLRPDDVAPFLFEQYGKRRSCMSGNLCRGLLDFPKADGVILMEFLTPEQEQVFIETGALPSQVGPCILCTRFIIQRLINEIRRNGHECRRAVSPHHYVVDEPGGYARDAIVSSQPEATDGNCWPQRKYNPGDYKPVKRQFSFDGGSKSVLAGFVEEGCFFA